MNVSHHHEPLPLSCWGRSKPLLLGAAGITIIVGTIFLMLAAHQILPAGPNPVSQLGLKSLWNILPVIGLALIILAIAPRLTAHWGNFRDPCPNLQYRMISTPQLVFTNENVNSALKKLTDDLKATMVHVEGHTDKSAYEILQEMHSIHYHGEETSFLNERYVRRGKEGLCAGHTQMQWRQSGSHPERHLITAQENIEEILYEQIKVNLIDLLDYSGSHKSVFYFATIVGRKTPEEKILLKQQTIACLDQVFGFSFEESFGKRADGKELTKEDTGPPFSRIKLSVDLSAFKTMCSLYLKEDRATGRIRISRGAFQNNVDAGHELWFHYTPEGYYVQDTIDPLQGLFKFTDKDSFIEGLYRQIQLHPELFPSTAYFRAIIKK